MARRALSLHARQLMAASLGLVAFLGLTGYALDHAFQETAHEALKDRLENYVMSYYQGMEFARNGSLLMPERPPDQRFERPGSGLYAGLVSRCLRREAASSLGRVLLPPPTLELKRTRLGGPLPYPARPDRFQDPICGARPAGDARGPVRPIRRPVDRCLRGGRLRDAGGGHAHRLLDGDLPRARQPHEPFPRHFPPPPAGPPT